MAVTSVQDFQRLLEKSNLLSAEQLAEVKTWPEEEPKTLLARTVKAGWITPWQSQQLLAGKSQFLLGRYKLLDLIGVGGMGAVFKAMLPPFGRTVALKVMNKQLLKQPKSVTRFLREIRSAAAVDHPNLVRAYDADVDRDTYFLVMEYVAGRNLKSWIKAEQSLPIAWSCECIRQAALGLEHAFEQGMVHRDIKPSNLLVTDDGHAGLPLVKILDLGLARFASETEDSGDLTRSGQVLGTPDYIAPEQARNTRTADIRADIFSLGCTLFELLTGRLPFPGTTVMEKLMARASQDAFRVSLFRPDVPAGLDAIVARMLERDPQKRYATPADVAQALAPYAIGTAAEIPPPTPSAATDAVASQSESPPLTYGGFDVTTDAMLPGMATVMSRAAAASAARPRGVFEPRLRQLPRTWIATAAAVAVVVLLGVVLSLLPGKKPAPADGTAQQARPQKKLKKGAEDGSESPAAASNEDEESDPDRLAALWVLKQRGTVSVVPGPEAQSSGKAQQPMMEIQVAGDLPARGFRVMEAAIRAEVELREIDFARLAGLSHLKSLTLAGTRFADADLAALKKVETLSRLDLSDTPLTNAGLKFVATVPNLEALRLDRTRISRGAVEILRASKSLTELSLEGTAVSDPDLGALAQMSQLTSLNLAGTQVKGPGLRVLRNLKELTHLNLGGLPMQGNALVHLRGMSRITSLSLIGSRVTDAEMTNLSGLTGLKELKLGRTGVSGSGLKNLSLTWKGNLELLDLHETGVGDDGVSVLAEAKSLKSLNLRGTVVSDKGTEHVRALSQLEFLDLAGTRVTDARIAALREKLRGCRIEY